MTYSDNINFLIQSNVLKGELQAREYVTNKMLSLSAVLAGH